MTITINPWLTGYVLSVLFSAYFMYRIVADGPYWRPKLGPSKNRLKSRVDVIMLSLAMFMPVMNLLILFCTARFNGYLDDFYAWFEAPLFKEAEQEIASED